MEEKLRKQLIERKRKYNDKVKDIVNDHVYHLYADEGGMMGSPSFFLTRKDAKNVPTWHWYQCRGRGDFIRIYIERLIHLWKLDHGADYLDSFSIKVINK